jgi:putative DNA primase/helicase
MRRAWTWAEGNLEGLRAADPAVPEKLHDHAADNWRPLLAIGDFLGGPWPERAREAALALSGGYGDDGAAEILILADMKALFEKRPDERFASGERADERLASAEVLTALLKMEDRPWPEWWKGNPLTDLSLARLLKRFEIRPKQMKVDGKNVRGYEKADFEDAWGRYLTPEALLPLLPNGNGAFPEKPTRHAWRKVAAPEGADI